MHIVKSSILALIALFAFSALTWAAPAVQMVVTPTPVQAPAETTFIVVSQKAVPAVLELRITGQKAVRVALKKEAAHEYAGAYLLRQTGQLRASALTSSGKILISKSYRITKAPSHLFSKVIIAIIFFAVSIWYWRKSQRYSRPSK